MTSMVLRTLRAMTLAGLMFVISPGAARAKDVAASENPIAPLPRNAHPLHYRIELSPEASGGRFKGEMSVDIEVTQATADIVMNARELEFSSARLDGKLPARISVDAARQRVTFSFANTVAIGRHELKISYSGPINDQIEGLFKVDYPSAGGSKRMFLSHMCCAANGRRAAPLLGESGTPTAFAAPREFPTSPPLRSTSSEAPQSPEPTASHRRASRESPGR